MEMFWIVWNPRGASMPRVRHATEALAVAEAERLARENAGQQFFVLQANHMRSVDGMTRVTLGRAQATTAALPPQQAPQIPSWNTAVPRNTLGMGY